MIILKYPNTDRGNCTKDPFIITVSKYKGKCLIDT